MYRRLSSGEARLRVMELRLNHAQLQVSALRGENERLQTEVEDLQLAGAEGEEHRLLLEARLRDVSEFEGGGAEETGLEQLRGALLAAADQHIRSMGAEMRQLRREVSGRSIAANEELAEKESEVVALREQLQSLSDQLAQRTVLYSAVDRRYRDEVRTRELTETELVAENRNLTARLQQLERQYSDVDGQRVEALLTVRQQRDTIAKLETEEASARARTQALDEELMTITTQCQTLQRVVEQLRGSDLEALEKDMAAEVEAVRQASRSKEDELRRQLGEARDLLQGESARRDALFAEMEQLRRERDEKEELLHMLENEGGRGRDYGFGDVKERSNAVNNAVTTMLGVLTDLIDHVQRQKECTDRSALLQSMEAVALALCKEMHGEHVHEEAVVFRLRELFSAQEHGPSDNAAPGDSSSLDVNFLTGRDEYSEELILKHRALESELQSAQQREAQLKQAIHDQVMNSAFLVAERSVIFILMSIGRQDGDSASAHG